MRPEQFTNVLGPLLVGAFIVYLIFGTNFLGGSFNCELSSHLRKSFLGSQLLVLALVYVLTNLVAGKALKYCQGKLVGFSVALYAMLFLAARADHRFQGVAVFLLLAIIVLQMVRQQPAYAIDATKKKSDSEGDDHDDGDDEEEDDNNDDDNDNVKLSKRMRTAQWAMGIAMLVIVMLGVAVLIGRQKVVFKGAFSWGKYFRGEQCLDASNATHMNVSLTDAAKGLWSSPSGAFVGQMAQPMHVPSHHVQPRSPKFNNFAVPPSPSSIPANPTQFTMPEMSVY